MTQLEIAKGIKRALDFAVGYGFTLLMLCGIVFVWIPKDFIWKLVLTFGVLTILFAALSFAADDRVDKLIKKGNP